MPEQGGEPLAPGAIVDALLPAHDAVFVKDRGGRYLMINEAGAATLGCQPDQVVGKTDLDIFPGTFGQRVRLRDQAIMITGEPRTVEEPVIVDGQLRIYVSTKAPLRDTSGAVIGLVGVSSDVTALRDLREQTERREAQLAEAQALTQVGSWEWQVGADEQSWSEETYRIFGRDPEAFEPTVAAFMDGVHPADRERLAAEVERSIQPGSGGAYELEHRIVRPDGEERICHCRARVFFDLDGAPLRMIGAVQDVTEQRRGEAELAAQQLQLTIAQELTGLGSWEWDPAADRVTWSEGMCRIYGLAPGEFEGTFEAGLARLHPEDRRASRERAERALRGDDPGVAEVRVVQPDGEIRVVRSYMRVIGDDVQRTLRIVGAFEDITERKRQELDLELRALRDQLTGLANRTLTFDRLHHALELARRSRSRLALLFIDLDGFKLVNDELGHQAGDLVLASVAERLRESVRASDTLGRLGGDEFVAICEDVPSAEGVLRTAERVRGALAGPYTAADQECRLSASIGIAFAAARHESTEDLLREADRAMYLAKRAGGNRVIVSDPDDWGDPLDSEPPGAAAADA
jgi:diguanylate cyclase (GGDEF)-like protein/PAS domain S-box-containing protein